MKELGSSWARAEAHIGCLRLDALALLSAVAESSTHVRQCGDPIEGDVDFGAQGYLVQLIVRGENVIKIAA
jgi:hypothetical protein